MLISLNYFFRLKNASVNYWISRGADPQKLILGTPFYGKSYKLTNKARTGLGVPVSGPGPIGPYTQQSGVLGYNEVVYLFNSPCRLFLYQFDIFHLIDFYSLVDL